MFKEQVKNITPMEKLILDKAVFILERESLHEGYTASQARLLHCDAVLLEQALELIKMNYFDRDMDNRFPVAFEAKLY